MKLSGNLIYTFLILILVSSLYRVIPGRPWGFAPQIAMTFFCGAIIKDKKLAFLLPILSMFISDVLYEILFRNNIGNMPGFYDGQLTNYLLFASMTIFGFFIKKINVLNVFAAALAAPTAFFLLSNFLLWANGGGLNRPKNFSGLIMAYNDGWPFYGGSVLGSLVFAAIFFGSYILYAGQSKLTLKQLA